MKRLPFIAAAASLMLVASCAKESTRLGVTTPGNNMRTTTQQMGDGEVGISKTEFTLSTNKDPLTQEALCVEPAGDCASINISSSRMEELDEMIENNTLEATFSSRVSSSRFTIFNDLPEIKSGLAQGRLTLVRETNSAGDVFYIVVRKGTVNKGERARQEQVIRTFMVPAATAIQTHN
ncbi:MAG: hypothetical protein MUC87_07775 [Bacteroidia bacterium]|jgi:hypothetical protein|nr:hypothetical protein [Bacteroidia bacterium]